MQKRILPFLVISSLYLGSCKSLEKTSQEIPSNALQRLQAGNRRFIQHRMKHPDQSAARIAETASGQKPFAVVLTCSDSRVSPEIIFDEGLGDLFVIRNAGNIVDEEDVLASVEYAVEHLGVHTVVIMGHERCGAIEAMTHEFHEGEPEHVAAILHRLKSEPEEQIALHSGSSGEALVHECVVANVAHGVTALSQTLRHLKGHGTEAVTAVIGAVYDVQTGIVHFQKPSPEIN